MTRVHLLDDVICLSQIDFVAYRPHNRRPFVFVWVGSGSHANAEGPEAACNYRGPAAPWPENRHCPHNSKVAIENDVLHAPSARDELGYTRERRRPLLRVYFTGRRFGSIFARPVPLFTSMI